MKMEHFGIFWSNSALLNFSKEKCHVVKIDILGMKKRFTVGPRPAELVRLLLRCSRREKQCARKTKA